MVFQATIELQNITKIHHLIKWARRNEATCSFLWQQAASFDSWIMYKNPLLWEGLTEASVLGNIQLNELMEEEENSDKWKQAVSFDRWTVYRNPLPNIALLS